MDTIDDEALREMGEMIINARQQGLPVQLIADIFEESFYKTTASPLKSPHASDDEESTDADDEASLSRLAEDENNENNDNNSQLLDFINLIQFYSEKAETLQNQLIPAEEMEALLAEAESKGVPRDLVLKIFEIASSFEQSDDSDNETEVTATTRHALESRASGLDCPTDGTTLDQHPDPIATPVRNNMSREWNFDEEEDQRAPPFGREEMGLLYSMDENDIVSSPPPIASRMRSWGELYDESVGSFEYQINKSATMNSLRNNTTIATDPTRSNVTWESIYSDVSGSTDDDDECRTIQTQQAFGFGQSIYESDSMEVGRSQSGPMEVRRGGHRQQSSVDSDSLVDAHLYQIVEERSIRKQSHQYTSSMETFETFETEETVDANNRVNTNSSRFTQDSSTTHQTASFLSQISTADSIHHQGVTSIGTYSTVSAYSQSSIEPSYGNTYSRSSIEPPCGNPKPPNRPTDYGQTWDSNTHHEPLFDSCSSGSGSYTDEESEGEDGSEYTYESCLTDELDSDTTVSQSDGSLLSLYDIQLSLSDPMIEELRDDEEAGLDGYEELPSPLQTPQSGAEADDDNSDALSDLSMPNEGLLPNTANDTLPEDETEMVEHISKKLDALIVANAENGERKTVFQFYESSPEQAMCVYDQTGAIVPVETTTLVVKESEEEEQLFDVYGNPMDNDDSTFSTSDSEAQEPQSNALVPVCNELALPPTPTSQTSSSSSEDHYPEICKKFSSMEEVDDTEDIKAFFKRIITLKEGGHLQDIRTDGLGIPTMSSCVEDNSNSDENDAVEVDRVFGYVNKELEKETPKPVSPEERLWSERRERDVFVKYADYLETLPVTVEPHTGAIVVAGSVPPESPIRRETVAELRLINEHNSEVYFMEERDVEVAFVDKEEEERATEKSRNKVRWRFGWEFEKGLKRQDDVVLGRKVRTRARTSHSLQARGGGKTSSSYVNSGLQHLEKIFEEREEKVWRDYENEFLLNWTSPWEKRWDLDPPEKNQTSSHKMMMLQEGLTAINGVSAVKLMRMVGFPSRGRRRSRGWGALRPLSRAASHSWGDREVSRRTAIDIYSLEESTSLSLTPHRWDDVPWQNRNVRQRFFAEKSVMGRNWFGRLTSHKLNDKCHQPISHPKSVDVGTALKSFPEPDSWDEEWYATWKSRKENPNNLVLHERNDEREKNLDDSRSCATEWTPGGWTTKGSGIVNNRSGFFGKDDASRAPMDDCRSIASCQSRYRVYPNINAGLSTMTPSYSMSYTSSYDMAGVVTPSRALVRYDMAGGVNTTRALVPHRPPPVPVAYDSCLSVFTEEKVFSWEETPTVGMICTLRLKKREETSRVHWDHTSFLGRSRWKRKYMPSGPFKT